MKMGRLSAEHNVTLEELFETAKEAPESEWQVKTHLEKSEWLDNGLASYSRGIDKVSDVEQVSKHPDTSNTTFEVHQDERMYANQDDGAKHIQMGNKLWK